MSELDRKRKVPSTEAPSLELLEVPETSAASTGIQEYNTSSSTTTSEMDDSKKDPSFFIKETKKPQSTLTKGRKKIDFIDDNIISILDTCKISDPCAVRLIIAVAEALGHKVNELTVNRSTILNRRHLKRKEIVEKIQDDFQVGQFRSIYLFLKNPNVVYMR